MVNVRYAIKQIIPIVFVYIFVGIACGILMVEAGYSALWSAFAGFFIYAGSMQLVMIPLLKIGAPLYTIAIITFLINARHIFYGISFVEGFRKMGKKYPYMILTLTDEVYSIFCSNIYPEEVDEQQADFLIALFAHLLWTGSCIVGALLGEFLPFDMQGIEFSATAFFLVVCVNQWIEFDSKIPVTVGFLSGIGFYFLFGAENFLLPALIVSLIALLILKENIIMPLKKEDV